MSDSASSNEGRAPIIEPSAYSTGMFTSVRPGPNGYRQRKHATKSQQPRSASAGGVQQQQQQQQQQEEEDDDLFNLWNDADERWTEEEREMFAALLDEMARKKRAAYGEDLTGGESAAEVAAASLIATGRIGQVPVLLTVVPAMGSLFFGSAKAWGDSIALLAIGWLLYYITQFPWDVYETARLRTRVHLLRRRDPVRLARLQRYESIALIATFVAPVVAALSISLLRGQMTALSHISPGSVLLYVLATLMRPFTHVTTGLRRRAARLRRELTWNPHEADRLRLQMTDIEDQVAELRLLVVREDEMSAIKEEVLAKVERAVRHVKSVARKEERQLMEVKERVSHVEDRVSGAEEWLEQQQVQQAHQNLLVRCVFEPVEVLKEMAQIGRGRAKATVTANTGVVGEVSDEDAEDQAARQPDDADTDHARSVARVTSRTH